MKKRLAIYPFYEELISVLNHKDKILDYEVVFAIIPKGWESHSEFTESNAECFCSEEKFYAENLIDSVDAFLLCKPIFEIDMSIYDRIIALGEKYRKQIIYVPELDSVITKTNNEQLICLQSEMPCILVNSELASIDVPVVMVLGLGENCEKWDVQLGLYDYFTQYGYKVSLISSNPLSRLMGNHNIPYDIDSTELTFSQQVKSINSFVKNVELEENPDVIILGVPGAILSHSQSVPNGYGHIPFLICNAVTPDLSILSLYCGKYEEKHIKEIKSTCYYRLGANVNYLHISKIACNYNFETRKMDYFSVDKSFLTDNIIRELESISSFNITDSHSREKVFKNIMQELQNNTAAI